MGRGGPAETDPEGVSRGFSECAPRPSAGSGSAGRADRPTPQCPAMAPLVASALLVLAASLSLVPRAHSISFQLPANSRKPEGHFRVPDQLIILNTKHGVEAKNYEDIAKAEKLKPLEVELRRLEDLSESIVNDFAYMKQREEEMRDTNESTSARVLYFSIFSMCCLIGLATWQVFYLRRFFKAKKLIE
ncbi:hypothetical protein chiPu_0021334 [Chiloscyllium punctatum]|uniref:GOLD domain-containing protein n=1 Tax=Chiloscyllium punctatum TaxID=137246 RepID=A0A401RPZ7_CHIPU|nr:hypothetical protein [Chiloscyllium punctatum]